MTGLDPDTDSIIEIYCLITDGQLELLDESGWGTVIHQTRERMALMDEWCTRVRRCPPTQSPRQHFSLLLWHTSTGGIW
jgi:oligoribonuclease